MMAAAFSTLRHARRKTLWMWAGVLLLVVLTTGILTAPGAQAIDPNGNGPDTSEYGGANVAYQLSDTPDVNDTYMQIPMYFTSIPNPIPTVTVTCLDGAGIVSVAGTQVCPSPTGSATFQLPSSLFAYDTASNLWVAYVLLTLQPGTSATNYRDFTLHVNSGGLIGYSAGNTSHFAIANRNRCDYGGDQSGCQQYFNYALPFAPSCSVASGPAQIEIFDADLPHADADGWYGVQPYKDFTFSITDTTTGSSVPITTSGSFGNNSSGYINFSTQQGHKYLFNVSQVYADNVLQFHLPYDSIYYQIPCSPPTASLSASGAALCGGITGTAFDPNNSGSQLSYNVYEPSKTAASLTGGVTSGPSPHNFSIPWSAITGGGGDSPNFSPVTLNIVVHGVNPGGAPDGFDTTITTTVGPCATASCMTSTFPSLAPDGETVQFTVSVSLSQAFAPPMADSVNPVLTVKLTDPSGNVVPGIDGSPKPYNHVGNVVTSLPISFTPSGSGTYQLLWSLNGSTLYVAANNCPGHGDAGPAPYFQVLGGDTAAGLSSNSGAASCTPLSAATTPKDSDAIIRGWNHDGATMSQHYGAGGQDAALALGNIDHFVTGLNPLALAGNPASSLQTALTTHHDLSFANDNHVNDAAGNYGGNFGSFGYCMDDYVYEASQRGYTPISGSFVISSATPDGVYYANSGNLNLSGTLSAGQHITVIVTNGSVQIGSNLAYPAAVPTANAVPYFELLAKGSIYVDSSVTNLYGFYDAQGGTFATCTSGGTAEKDDTGFCSNQLYIDGAVSAQTIHFDRTLGSYTGVGGVAQPAEVIRFSPALWVASMYYCSNNPLMCPDSNVQYDSVTGLPPEL